MHPPPPPSASDADLVRLAADPDRAAAALRLIYERHAESLLAFARARFPDVADDLARREKGDSVLYGS